MCGFVIEEKENRILCPHINGIITCTVGNAHGTTGANDLYTHHHITLGTVVYSTAELNLCSARFGKQENNDIKGKLFQNSCNVSSLLCEIRFLRKF